MASQRNPPTKSKDKAILFPHGQGSAGGSYAVHPLAKNETGPVAIINMTTGMIIAVGARVRRPTTMNVIGVGRSRTTRKVAA